jgi:hypothetical protein
MQYKSLDEINAETILSLVGNQAEDDHIEYKRVLLLSNNCKLRGIRPPINDDLRWELL